MHKINYLLTVVCMRTYLILILILILFVTKIAVFAQVTNDDCSSAINLGYLNGTWYNDTTDVPCFNGDGNADVNISGSIDTSVIANYPYPQNPLPCEGYINSIASPARDLWYYITGVSCDLIFKFFCSDTTHISIWLGNNCSTLQPLQCYTLLPNTYITRTINGHGIGLYFQISSNSITNSTSFASCLYGSEYYCSPTYTYTDQTPVLCNNNHFEIVNESYPGANDGVVNVSILNGNSPYSYQWSTGLTDSVISNLSAGWYFVTITDNNNCIETDSVKIETITNIQITNKNSYLKFYPNPVISGYDFTIYSSDSNPNSVIEIYKITGILYSQQAQNKEIKINTKGFGKGVFWIKVKNSEGVINVEKLIIL